VHIDKLKEYLDVPPKSWIPSTTNGEPGTATEEATSVSAPPVIQVSEAQEVAENQCPNSPDQTQKSLSPAFRGEVVTTKKEKNPSPSCASGRSSHRPAMC